jgi:ATP-binding cassette subfamily B protein
VVIEQGTHDELVSTGGTYAALWRVQTGARASAA